MSRDDLWTAAELAARFGTAIRIGVGCQIPRDTTIEVGTGGFLAFGDRVSIRRGVVIEVSDGATAIFGDDVTIGENAVMFVMVGLSVGDGCGISNMVDIHDHNHRPRALGQVRDDDWTPYGSGFVAAPIVLESGAVLSNKVSVMAGVRIGYNTIVGANAAVTRSLPPNAVAASVPARVVRTFEGTPPEHDDRREVHLGFFGTSIMEHREGVAPRLFQQWNLPAQGESVVVEGFRTRGYVHRLALALQADRPHLRFRVHNHGVGGATSRDVLAVVRRAVARGDRLDVAVFGCGLNDVWRRFQGRPDEAVDLTEYTRNCAEALSLLRSVSRHTVLVTETPFGFPDAAAMNAELRRYAEAAMRVAEDCGAHALDVYPAVAQAARTMRAGPEDGPQRPSVWSDGIHLSELGDAILARRLGGHLADSGILNDIEQYAREERTLALERYRDLCTGWRSRARDRQAVED